MKRPIFDSFSEMINGLPASVLLKAIELEHRMLEEDLLYKRIPESAEVDSVLSFCEFIAAVSNQDDFCPVIKLSLEHIAFYRGVIIRLIEADKIPVEAKAQFDLAFSLDFIKALSAN
jgi:hypothetical protein